MKRFQQNSTFIRKPGQSVQVSFHTVCGPGNLGSNPCLAGFYSTVKFHHNLVKDEGLSQQYNLFCKTVVFLGRKKVQTTINIKLVAPAEEFFPLALLRAAQVSIKLTP